MSVVRYVFFVRCDLYRQAVRAALSETHVIQQTKRILEEEGVNLAALERAARGDAAAVAMKRSKKVILVKNLPFAVRWLVGWLLLLLLLWL